MVRFLLKKTIILVVFMILISGCASIQEPFKTFWGSSTRVLREAKNSQAEEFNCSYNDCFDKTLKILKGIRANIFINNRLRGEIVVMNVKDSIDTTEVGIFFMELGNNKVKIKVTSLSPRAVDAVANDLFSGLEKLLTTQ